MAEKKNIGAKLTVDGEKEFKSAISAASKELTLIAAEAKKTAAEYAGNKDSLEALTAQGENFQKQIDAQRAKVDAVRAAYENCKDQLGENADKTKDWEAKLINAETALIKTENAAKANAEQVKKLNEEEEKQHSVTGKIESALSKLTSGYDKAKDKVHKFKEEHPKTTAVVEKLGNATKKVAEGGLKAIGSAAAGAVAGVGAVAAGATAAAKQLFDMASAASESGDVVDKASQRMGISAESYQQLSYAANLSGVSIKTMETAAKNLQKSGSNLDMSTALKQIASIKDESERSAKAAELFGAKAGYELAPMLNAGADGIKDMMDKASELGLVMSNEAVSASAKFGDSLSTLKGTATALKNNIVAEMMPGITEVMDGLTGLMTGDEGAVEQVRKGAESIVGSIKVMVPKLLGIVQTLIPSVAEIAPQIIVSLSTALMDNIGPVIEAALSIVTSLASSLLSGENIQKIITAAFDLVFSLADFLINNIDMIIDAAFDLIDGIINGLLANDNITKLLAAALDIVAKIATGLIDNIPTLLQAVPKICIALWDAIKNYDWWGLAKSIFLSLKDSIKNMFTGGGNDEDGSHAGGLGFVPYNGYVAKLHKGEKVLTEAEAKAYEEEQRRKEKEDNPNDGKDNPGRKDDNPPPVNIYISGSASSVVRALNITAERENRRSSAFKKSEVKV